MNNEPFADMVAPSWSRRAAVVLHGLSDQDREWILGRLPQGQQDELRELVQELAALGVPPAAMVDVEVVVPHPDPQRLDSDEEFLAQLSDLEVRRLAHSIAFLPAPVIASCLQIRRWPWRTTVLESLPDALARDVRDALNPGNHDKANAPRLRAALARELRRHVECTPASTSAATPPRRNAPFMLHARAWFGRFLRTR